MRIKARNKLQCIKGLSAESKLCIVTICLQLLALYYNISSIGLPTHDDLHQYLFNTRPTWKAFLSMQGELDVLGGIFGYIQYSAPTIAIYRIYTMIGICLSLSAAALFVKHHVSEKNWMKYVILFLAIMQIGYLHNGAISFGMGYQYRMLLCFACLDLYLLWCKYEKKKYYILSTIFWILAINAYEAFYMFCFMLFIFAFLFLYKKKELSIKNLFRYLWLPALFTVLSFGIYLLRSSGNTYGGTTIDSSYGIIDKIKSVLIYTFGMFPLRINTFSARQVLDKILILDYTMLFVVVKNLLVAIVICKGIVCDKIKTVKNTLVATGVAGVGAVLCSFLVGITSQFCNWAIEQGMLLYGVSYYSYFFIVLCIFLILGVLLKTNKKYLKIFIFTLIFSISFVTELNNMEVAIASENMDNKYELFDEIVNSEYMLELEDNIVIYAPEMLGVHHDLSSLDKYCDQITGKNVRFCNQISEVDFSEEVYMLRYISESESMILGKVEDEQLVTDNMYVLSLQELCKYSLCALKSSDDISKVKINEITMGLYEDDIAIPLNQFEGLKEIKISANDISLLDVSLVTGSVVNNATMSYEYGEGVSFQEEFGRWCATTSSYIINNKEDEVKQGVLYLTLQTATGESGDVIVEVNGNYMNYKVGANPVMLEIDVALQEGKNCITVISQIDSLDTTDMRDINLKLTDAYCMVDGIQYSFC